MADILDLIKSRRNISKFEAKFLSWEKISNVLDAGRHAPSSGNIQNWKFIVILESEQKQTIAAAAFDQYDIALAGALIIVCAEPEKAERYYGLRGERLYSVQNCAAAIQNMLLEAHSLGLGGGWIGAFDEEAVKESCSIPEEVRPQAIIAIGYPAQVPEKPPKYPLENLVYFGSWRRKMRDPAKYMHDMATILARKAENFKGMAKDALKKVGEPVAKKVKEKFGKDEIAEQEEL